MNRSERHLYRLGLHYVSTAKEIALTDPPSAVVIFGLSNDLVRALADMSFDIIEAFVLANPPRFEPTVPLRTDLQPRDYLMRVALYHAGGFRSLPSNNSPSRRKRLQPPHLIDVGATHKTNDLIYRLNRSYLATLQSLIASDITHASTLFVLTHREARIVRDTALDDLEHFARVKIPLFKPVFSASSGHARRDFLRQLKRYASRRQMDKEYDNDG